ncbi:hypothetical protein FB451DRAFT_1172238 [Mycena latifolia]|nr:hypothetical protein FB451DRAFT_1172238 [Mycena latifolia]
MIVLGYGTKRGSKRKRTVQAQIVFPDPTRNAGASPSAMRPREWTVGRDSGRRRAEEGKGILRVRRLPGITARQDMLGANRGNHWTVGMHGNVCGSKGTKWRIQRAVAGAMKHAIDRDVGEEVRRIGRDVTESERSSPCVFAQVVALDTLALSALLAKRGRSGGLGGTLDRVRELVSGPRRLDGPGKGGAKRRQTRWWAGGLGLIRTLPTLRDDAGLICHAAFR